MRRGMILTAAVVLALGVAGCGSPPQGHADGGRVRIGCPDDTGGMLVHFAASLAEAGTLDVRPLLQPYELNDCCSSKSQIALAVEALDMAVLCPSAAADLLAADPRFEVAGPLVVNSDVVVLRPGGPVGRVGVTQNRTYQADVVREVAGAQAQAVPMLTTSLAYAYKIQAVDGVVVDALTCFSLDGEKRSSAGPGGDRVTYVLVVRTTAADDPAVRAAEEALSGAAQALADPTTLRKEVETYAGRAMTGEEVAQWRSLGIGFKIEFATKNY
jgi:hypothetical protein